MPPRKVYGSSVAESPPPQTNMFQADKGINVFGGNFVQQNQTLPAVHLCHEADGELESERLRSVVPLV